MNDDEVVVAMVTNESVTNEEVVEVVVTNEEVKKDEMKNYELMTKMKT